LFFDLGLFGFEKVERDNKPLKFPSVFLGLSWAAGAVARLMSVRLTFSGEYRTLNQESTMSHWIHPTEVTPSFMQIYKKIRKREEMSSIQKIMKKILIGDLC